MRTDVALSIKIEDTPRTQIEYAITRDGHPESAGIVTLARDRARDGDMVADEIVSRLEDYLTSVFRDVLNGEIGAAAPPDDDEPEAFHPPRYEDN